MLTTCKLELVKGYLCQIEKSETNDYCHRHQRYFERDTQHIVISSSLFKRTGKRDQAGFTAHYNFIFSFYH